MKSSFFLPIRVMRKRRTSFVTVERVNTFDESLSRSIYLVTAKRSQSARERKQLDRQMLSDRRVRTFVAFINNTLTRRRVLECALKITARLIHSKRFTFATCYPTEHKLNNGATQKLKNCCSLSSLPCEFITRYHCVVIISQVGDVICAVRLFNEKMKKLQPVAGFLALFTAQIFLHNSQLGFDRVGCPLDRETARVERHHQINDSDTPKCFETFYSFRIFFFLF